MKNIIFLLLLVVAIPTLLVGKIIETACFKDILNYVQPNTLVLLDIDDTLLLPVQTLGTDVWFQYRMRQYATQGIPSDEALQKALTDWIGVRYLTAVAVVEEGIEQIVKKLQDDKVLVMGLTTQCLALATHTAQQLRGLAIDLSRSAPCPNDHYFMNSKNILYTQGILFTAGTNKGQAMLTLLNRIGFFPAHIVFINDKASHLRDVEQAIEAKGIAFTGLRYNYCDSRVASFDPEIADIQWQHSSFSHILSDNEARAIKEKMKAQPLLESLAH